VSEQAAHLVRSPSREALRTMAGVAVLAGLLSLGPLIGAVVNSVEIEVAIGVGAHLPVPEFLPAALDPVAGIALLVMAALQPERALRTWCWFLVFAVLAAAMATGGAHAVFKTDQHGHLILPAQVAFGVSMVPAASAAATLHLLLLIVARWHAVRALLRSLPEQVRAPLPDRETSVAADREGGEDFSPIAGGDFSPTPGAQAADDVAHPVVLEALRTGRGYRTVVEGTGWPRARAQAALAAARAESGTPFAGPVRTHVHEPLAAPSGQSAPHGG
jgi:hypothetical protein